jgi:hypothetical protein
MMRRGRCLCFGCRRNEMDEWRARRGCGVEESPVYEGVSEGGGEGDASEECKGLNESWGGTEGEWFGGGGVGGEG